MQAGVIPVIFAKSLLYIPQLIVQLQWQNVWTNATWWVRWTENNLVSSSSRSHHPLYLLCLMPC